MNEIERVPTSDEEYKYLTFVSERLFDMLKLDLLLITSYPAVISFIIKFTDIGLREIFYNLYIIASVFSLVISIGSIITLFHRINPEFVTRSSLIRVSNKYEKIIIESNENKDLNMISNYLTMCLVLIGITGGLFLLGVAEAGFKAQFGVQLPIGFIVLFSTLVIMYILFSFISVGIITGLRTGIREFKYRMKERYGCWRWDLAIQHHEVSWLDILDYRILKNIDNNDDQTAKEISSQLLCGEERVRKRLDILSSKDMIEQSENYYSLGIDGHKFLHGYQTSLDLRAIGEKN